VALRAITETQRDLPPDAGLDGAPLSRAEAERLDRLCINVKVAVEELRQTTGVLTRFAAALAGRACVRRAEDPGAPQ
jgi:hypothetical protein